MHTQNLTFNVLTFDWPAQPLTFYFSKEEKGICKRLHKSNFPNNIERLFPAITASNTEFLYTSFVFPAEGFQPLKIDAATENECLIKRYYTQAIRQYFKKNSKYLVEAGFIDETIIYVYAPNKSTDQYHAFKRFSLKVQLSTVSRFPEILLSFDGISKIFNQSMAHLISRVDEDDFKRVVYNKRVMKYEDWKSLPEQDEEHTFPVVNNELRDAFGIAADIPPTDNRYKRYKNEITSFYEKSLNNSQFKALIPLHKGGFLKVTEQQIRYTSPAAGYLEFRGGETHTCPMDGLKKFKPYDRSPHQTHLFFIAHTADLPVMNRVKNALLNGCDWFKGLREFADLWMNHKEQIDITFTNRDNPLPEIEAKLQTDAGKRKEAARYLAFYISPFGKDDPDPEKRKIYYQVKEALLRRGITIQVMEATTPGKMDQNFVYSLPNVAIAMLAKLDGIPWRLHVPPKNDLIVGVGAFRPKADDVQYLGSTFCFGHDGRFKEFNTFLKHQTDLLAGAIANAVRNYTEQFTYPDRLIIHFYKVLSQKELEPIQKALENLELKKPIPIFIVTINKTEAEDIVAFDNSWAHLMPLSGTILKVSSDQFLLFNNARYPDAPYKKTGKFPFPLKLRIQCTDRKHLDTKEKVRELIEQVYQFSRMYWKSVSQQNLPVTIKYPEMVARMLPYFQDGKIPEFGRKNLWFL